MFEYRTLPIIFPEKEIFLRLGGHLTKTQLLPEEKCRFLRSARAAFELCRPAGRWEIFPVGSVDPQGVTLQDGTLIPGGDFAARCQGITHLWCAAVTVGSEVTDARDHISDVTTKAIYDAAASESADAAMDAIFTLSRTSLRRQAMGLDKNRYSPGYGDMPLPVQKFFFSALKLEELDLTLNENFYLIPEKSVTAFAGIKKIKE